MRSVVGAAWPFTRLLLRLVAFLVFVVAALLPEAECVFAAFALVALLLALVACALLWAAPFCVVAALAAGSTMPPAARATKMPSLLRLCSNLFIADESACLIVWYPPAQLPAGTWSSHGRRCAGAL